jgi:lipoprotein-releasing system permease protein
MRFSLFLALKYLKPKRSVTSVITCVSVIGVLLGVAVVVIVRAVMTGFGDLWQEKILDFKPHVTLRSQGLGPVIRGEEALAKQISEIPGVTAVSPEINTPVMLQFRGRIATPVVLGVDPDRIGGAYNIGAPRAGSYDLEGDSIVLGIDLARSLGVWVGDDVTVYSPKTLASRDEIFLPLKWRVTGIFSSGQRDYDAHFAICSLPNARDLMGLEDGVFAVHVKTSAPADAPALDAICARIADIAPACRVETWRQTDRQIFNALAVEKNMTAFLLMLITVVALFCVMNTLLVLTVQKTSEIGLLKALGFSKLKIMGAFMVHGLVQVTTGTVLGLGVSYVVLRNLQNIVEQLARFGVEVFPKEIYGLDAIPYRLTGADLVWVVAVVYVFGLLASFVPAFLAASKNPVEALKG